MWIPAHRDRSVGSALRRALILLTLLIGSVCPAWSDEGLASAVDTFRGMKVHVLEGTLATGSRLARPAVVLEDRGREVWRSSGSAFQGVIRIRVSGLADIDADGLPELHLVSWTGGAHCCLTHHFLQRDERWGVHVKATVDQGNGEQSPLLMIEGRKLPIILVPDNVFAYAFGACYACSPMPYVPLSFDGIRFSLARDVLEQAELSGCLMSLGYVGESDLTPLARNWRATCRKHVAEWGDDSTEIAARMRSVADREDLKFAPENCELCVFAAQVMNPLVYAGRFAQAEEALKRVWPAGVSGRQRASAVYWANLRQSIYWDDIQSIHFEALRKARLARMSLRTPPEKTPPPKQSTIQ
jgi:hypothetical protein